MENQLLYEEFYIQSGIKKPVNITDVCNFSNDIAEALFPKEKKEVMRMKLKNLKDYGSAMRKTKNKGIKHKLRGGLYKWNNEHHQYTWDSEKFSVFFRKHIPAECIARETTTDFYMMCPFHAEKTPSCTISKNHGIVKCFGCGKSYNIATFLSILLGNTRKYWDIQMKDAHTPAIDENPGQLRLDFDHQIEE